MDEKEQLQDHEQRIQRLEDGQDDIRHRMDNLSEEVKRGNISNDKANEFLMKQNMHITDLLGGIQQKKQEVHKWTWKAIFQLAVTAGSIATIISFLLSHFLK
jgi:chromosome segregation ATPase